MCWLCIGRVRWSCVGWTHCGSNVQPESWFWQTYVGRKVLTTILQPICPEKCASKLGWSYGWSILVRHFRANTLVVSWSQARMRPSYDHLFP